MNKDKEILEYTELLNILVGSDNYYNIIRTIFSIQTPNRFYGKNNNKNITAWREIMIALSEELCRMEN